MFGGRRGIRTLEGVTPRHLAGARLKPLGHPSAYFLVIRSHVLKHRQAHTIKTIPPIQSHICFIDSGLSIILLLYWNGALARNRTEDKGFADPCLNHLATRALLVAVGGFEPPILRV